MELWNDIKDLDVRTSFLLWSLMMSYPKKALDGLIEENGVYSLYSLAQLRYIDRFIGSEENLKKCMKKYKKTEEILSVSNIVKYIEDELSPSIEMKNFAKNQKRNLESMFQVIFDNEASLDAIKNEDGEYEFNILDFGFCRYLLDTFDDSNSKKFRRGKYDEIEPSFLILVRKGASMFVKYHSEELFEWRLKKEFGPNRTYNEKYIQFINAEVKERWNDDFGEKKIRLSKSIEKLGCVLKQINELENKQEYIDMFKKMTRYIDRTRKQLEELLEEKNELQEAVNLKNIVFSDDVDSIE